MVRAVAFAVGILGLFNATMATDEAALTAARLYTLISGGPGAAAEKPNFVFSPLSIMGVFSMAQRGARGETKEEMDRLLAPDADLTLPSFEMFASDEEQAVVVKEANRLYVHRGLEGNPLFSQFSSDLKSSMSCDARVIDFANSSAAAAEINAFVSETTRGHITNLVDSGALSALTRLVLVNALYFKAPWASEFPEEASRLGAFGARTALGVQQQQVTFMHHLLERGFTYLKEEGVTGFSVGYSDYRLRMFVFMPDDLNEFEVALAEDPGALEGLAARVGAAWLPDSELELAIPKFKLAASDNAVDLAEVFAALGAPRMFAAGAADFSGIDGGRDLFVSGFVHQGDIEVDEKGTEASAATAMMVSAMSMPIPKERITITVNRPFVFQVRFVEAERPPLTLFSGRVADPKAAQ